MLLASVLTLLLGVQSSALTFHTVSHWTGGFQMDVKVPVCADLDGWKVHLTFSQDVESIEVWVATATKVSSREYVLSNKDFNRVVHSGESISFNFLGHASGDINPTVVVRIEGPADCSGAGGTLDPGQTHVTNAPRATTHAPTHAPSAGGGHSTKNYGDALAKSILFYAAQRSGKLPANNPISWRGDSALNDCVVGGWYDAGDHVKFALPFGATVHLLIWSMNLFTDGYTRAGQLDEMIDCIKWGIDYMLAAWNPATKEIVAQIGDGNTDHHFWGRAEDMTMERPCMKIGPSGAASDLAGEWAASLAAGYIFFKTRDPAYATKLLTAAESLYAFGKAHQGTYTSHVHGAGNFYSSAGFKDEMCEGAMWLYKATNNAQYLSDAKGFHMGNWPWALSWDDKMVACQLMLFEATHDATYKSDVLGFMNGWMPNQQLPYTPCGLAWRDTWGANRYAGNSAFFALAVAEAGIETATYRKWAVEQINFLLGDNNHDGGCFSYQIGYGTKYPLSPHHRSASCPDRPAPCTEANLHATTPSPQLLVGALVGGPDQMDNYKDSREDYIMNEVAIDYNAGFHAALAGIEHLIATGNMPVTNNKCPCTSK